MKVLCVIFPTLILTLAATLALASDHRSGGGTRYRGCRGGTAKAPDMFRVAVRLRGRLERGCKPKYDGDDA